MPKNILIRDMMREFHPMTIIATPGTSVYKDKDRLPMLRHLCVPEIRSASGREAAFVTLVDSRGRKYVHENVLYVLAAPRI